MPVRIEHNPLQLAHFIWIQSTLPTFFHNKESI